MSSYQNHLAGSRVQRHWNYVESQPETWFMSAAVWPLLRFAALSSMPLPVQWD